MSTSLTSQHGIGDPTWPIVGSSWCLGVGGGVSASACECFGRAFLASLPPSGRAHAHNTALAPKHPAPDHHNNSALTGRMMLIVHALSVMP